MVININMNKNTVVELKDIPVGIFLGKAVEVGSHAALCLWGKMTDGSLSLLVNMGNGAGAYPPSLSSLPSTVMHNNYSYKSFTEYEEVRFVSQG